MANVSSTHSSLQWNFFCGSNSNKQVMWRACICDENYLEKIE